MYFVWRTLSAAAGSEPGLWMVQVNTQVDDG